MSTSIRDGPILTPKLYLVKMFRLWVLFALGIDRLRYPQQRGGIRLVLLELKPSYLENLPLSGLRSWFVPFWSAAYRSWGKRKLYCSKKKRKNAKGGKLCRDLLSDSRRRWLPFGAVWSQAAYLWNTSPGIATSWTNSTNLTRLLWSSHCGCHFSTCTTFFIHFRILHVLSHASHHLFTGPGRKARWSMLSPTPLSSTERSQAIST